MLSLLFHGPLRCHILSKGIHLLTRNRIDLYSSKLYRQNSSDFFTCFLVCSKWCAKFVPII